MKRVLITGASGYIGKHITLDLLNSGYTVRASVRSDKKAEEVRKAIAAHVKSEIDLSTQLSFVVLDLESDAGWQDALRGMDVLMHTASPFPIASPKDENDLIKPAVGGTLRALKAAHEMGVKRVVLTSSTAAVAGTDLPAGKTAFDETVWSDVNHPAGSVAYTKSKTLAEQAAWNYIKTEAPEIELTTINPVLVLGAPLDSNFASSVSLIERVLKAKDPMLPDLHMQIVDVKDIARMHVNAIDMDAAKRERFIGNSGSMSFVEIAKTLKAAHPERKIKTLQAPNFLVRILALFDKEIKAALPSLGDTTQVSSAKAQSVLGINFIPAKQSVLETADYLVSNNLVK